MGTNRKKKEKAPKDCRDCERWNEVKGRVRVSEALQKAINAAETKINGDDFKPSIAEYLKLVQLAQDLEQDDVKEIKVTWVEPAAKSEPGK